MSTMGHFIRWATGFAGPETQTTEAERDCLVRHAAGRKRLAEIGVWHGVTTRLLRKAMSPNGILFAIDPFPVGRLRFSAQRVVARLGVNRIRNGQAAWLRMAGADACKEPSVLAGPIDFLFIDGDHTYDGLKGDWEGWNGLIASGGVIGLHDSRPTPTRPIHDAGSVRYTAEVISKDPQFSLVDEIDSLTVFRRVE
jgi:predicted O-methyltransferase YrrM